MRLNGTGDMSLGWRRRLEDGVGVMVERSDRRRPSDDAGVAGLLTLPDLD